jgi:hypothetical protein
MIAKSYRRDREGQAKWRKFAFADLEGELSATRQTTSEPPIKNGHPKVTVLGN